MDVSLREVWLRNCGSSDEEQNAEDSDWPRLFCFVDPGSRGIVAATVSKRIPDERALARLLSASGEKHRESENIQGNQ